MRVRKFSILEATFNISDQGQRIKLLKFKITWLWVIYEVRNATLIDEMMQ